MQLNPKQKEAAESLDGPVLVVAGAGAGKTRVLVERIVNLIKSGKAQAHEILAITFTNKAAKEMRQRVLARIDSDKDLNRPVNALYSGLGIPFVSTFHSLGVHIMREQAKTLGIKKHFNILDRQDQTRLIKESIKKLGLDPKEKDTKSIINTISRAKSDALNPELYLSQANSYYKEELYHIWSYYEKFKKEQGAFDFDDLLLVPLKLLQENDEVLSYYQNVWKYILVDEYQDTNKVQFELLHILADKHKNIFVVGDIDQCVTGDTMVKVDDNFEKPISELKNGDKILSPCGPGQTCEARILRFQKKEIKNASLINIRTDDEKEIISTKEHIYFAGYIYKKTPQKSFVYLMFKQELGYRVGVTQVYTKGQKRRVLGFKQRLNQEHADKIWIIRSFDTEKEARFFEQYVSVKYGLPTLAFVSRASGKNATISDQDLINDLFAKLNTENNAKRLMRVYGLYEGYPHHIASASAHKRTNVTVTIGAEKRSNAYLSRISVVSYDKKVINTLKELGLSVRRTKKHQRSFRYESAFADYKDALFIAQQIQNKLNANIVLKARFGKQKPDKRLHNSLMFTPASSLREGMCLFDSSGSYKLIESVEEIKKDKAVVYEIDVERYHSYFANGIATHNSIYSWRGAKPDLMLLFEKHFEGAKVISLEQNYRSTKTIIDAANSVIEKNQRRIKKTIFSENEDGDKIVYSEYFSAQDEAQAVAKKAKELIKTGVSPDEIAVLFRMNFISRVLEEAFLQEGVPYQLLGTKFFERKEVKDIISFLRLAINRDSLVDLHRASGAVPRGIGKVALLKIQEKKLDELSAGSRAKVENFFKLLDEIHSFALSNKLSDTLKFTLEKSGMEAHLKSKGSDGQERLANIFELIELSKKYDSFAPDEALEKFLEEASLSQDQDELEDKKRGVKLMTVHASKGLEFENVFLVALEQGIFPAERFDEKDDEEEERRLFYVALTRAKKRLFLSRAFERQVFGKSHFTETSEFIEDIPDELIEISNSVDAKDTENKNLGHDRGVDLIEW